MLLLNLLFVCMYMREQEEAQKKGKEKKMKKKGISLLVIRIFFFLCLESFLVAVFAALLFLCSYLAGWRRWCMAILDN